MSDMKPKAPLPPSQLAKPNSSRNHTTTDAAKMIVVAFLRYAEMRSHTCSHQDLSVGKW